jgi:outer membrane lipoprotein-sorting protein
MKALLSSHMFNPIFRYIAVLLIAAFAQYLHAGTPAQERFDKMERHLRGLQTLEVRYTAEGEIFADSALKGRMVWARPDRFYHDTPEWALAQIGDEKWRYLKGQNTLILETVRDDDAQLPEDVLFALKEDVTAETLTVDSSESGAHKLTLHSSNEQTADDFWLWLQANSDRPLKIAWRLPDGTIAAYRVESWRENISVDDGLFIRPEANETIDFRVKKGTDTR